MSYDDMCPDCGEPDGRCTCYDDDECPSCGTPGCPGYCDDFSVYNLRPFNETGGEPDPDEDRYDEYKDGVATGQLNPDGSQREPDPSDECLDSDSGDRPASDAAADPWALPEGETYDTEAPF